MSLDFATGFKFLFDDRDWWKTCLIIGLVSLIPVVGWLVLFGWMRRVFENVRNGQPVPLPSLDFGGDLGRGVAPVVAMLNPFVVVFVVFLVFSLGTMVAGYIADFLGTLLGLLTTLVMLVLWIATALIMPELVRRAFADNELLPLVKLGPSLAAIKGDIKFYLLVWVGSVIASFVAQIGTLVCCVGMLLTLPAGMAIYAHYLAQYDLSIRSRGGQAGGTPTPPPAPAPTPTPM